MESITLPVLLHASVESVNVVRAPETFTLVLLQTRHHGALGVLAYRLIARFAAVVWWCLVQWYSGVVVLEAVVWWCLRQ